MVVSSSSEDWQAVKIKELEEEIFSLRKINNTAASALKENQQIDDNFNG